LREEMHWPPCEELVELAAEIMPKFMASLTQILRLGFLLGNRIPAVRSDSSTWAPRMARSTSSWRAGS
jgi:hypothetical protein